MQAAEIDVDLHAQLHSLSVTTTCTQISCEWIDGWMKINMPVHSYIALAIVGRVSTLSAPTFWSLKFQVSSVSGVKPRGRISRQVQKKKKILHGKSRIQDGNRQAVSRGKQDRKGPGRQPKVQKQAGFKVTGAGRQAARNQTATDSLQNEQSNQASVCTVMEDQGTKQSGNVLMATGGQAMNGVCLLLLWFALPRKQLNFSMTQKWDETHK